MDLSPLSSDGSNGGSRPFVLGLLAALLAQPEPHELHLLVKPDAEGVVSLLQARGARVHLLGAPGGVSEPRRLARTRQRLVRPARAMLDPIIPAGRSLRALGVDTLFSPLGTAAFHESGLAHVAVAYDFQELDHPDFFTPAERRRRRAFRADLRRCQRVAAISRVTARAGVDRVGLRPERVQVIAPVTKAIAPLPDGEVARRLAALGLSEKGFVAYPANFWPHKNHRRLLEAVALLSPHAGDPFRLVLSGADATGRNAIGALIQSLGVGSAVTLLPYLADADLVAVLQGSRALVFPSLYEGFGLPVLEAFQLGTPVGCSSLPALEELAHDAALFFPPHDTGQIAGALERLWTDGALRARLRSQGSARVANDDLQSNIDAFHALLGASGSP
ncbi:MAG: glycosyltransferase family 1 protein [Thermoanaerobaculia bacterium]